MSVVALILVALVALIHLSIVVLEMALWTTSRGRAAFGLTPEFAQATKALAANQGLYNGFLAAGLIWGLFAPEHLRQPVLIFFTTCVVVAGVFGAVTASRKILFIQAIPGALALVAVLLAG